MFVLVIINKLAQTFYKEKKVSTRQQHYAGTTYAVTQFRITLLSPKGHLLWTYDTRQSAYPDRECLMINKEN